MLLQTYHIVLLLSSQGFVLAQNDEFPGKIDCYSWTNQVFPNNTQCPGSRICCQTEDLCDSNRFCVQHDQLVIPTCAVFPWDNCANICQYDPGTGFLPRAVECDDGSYCCDNDPPCCSENRGIVLNGLGAVVSTLSSTSTLSETTSTTNPTTTSTSAASTTPTSTGTTPTSTATAAANGSGSPPSSSNDLTTGAKAGIGIGAPVAAIAVIALIVLLIRSRRGKQKNSQVSRPPGPWSDQNETHGSHTYTQFTSAYTDRTWQPSELEVVKPQRGFEVHELPTHRGSRI